VHRKLENLRSRLDMQTHVGPTFYGLYTQFALDDLFDVWVIA